MQQDPESGSLTLAEANKRMSGTELHGTKQQELLVQAEQPSAVECAA